MDLVDHFRLQFAYNAWANREVLSVLSPVPAPPKAVQLLAHILAAEQVWLERLTQTPQGVPVWPEFTLQQCESHISEMANRWRDYVSKISPALDATISYKNTKGENWTSSIYDVLTHVLLHSAYHRGQIAREMRAAGQAPAYTDFIHAVRQGRVE